MILVLVLQFSYLIFVQSEFYEIDQRDSNDFLNRKFLSQYTYEESREIVESQRESCIHEYRQQQKSYRRNQVLPLYCSKYCTETTHCQEENEALSCTNPSYPSWPPRIIKFVQKYHGTCYTRITEIVRYEQAEQLCEQYGHQVAIIDNMPLLEYLKKVHMFNATCRGQCPKSRGYYIGLRRDEVEIDSPTSKWVWSNNVTWTQNETECGDEYNDASFVNSTLLCYIGADGEKKVTVWNMGEPNNYRYSAFESSEECVEIIARPDSIGSYGEVGRLNDISCVRSISGVICQTNDSKPLNLTRFKSFAKIVDFHVIENEDDYLWSKVLKNFDSSFTSDYDSIVTMLNSLERLLTLSSFAVEKAKKVFKIIDRIIGRTREMEIEHKLLKTITNRILRFLDGIMAIIQSDDNERTISFKNNNMKASFTNLNMLKWYQSRYSKGLFTVDTDDPEIFPKSIIQLNVKTLEAQPELMDNYRIIETEFSNFDLFPQGNTSDQYVGVPVSYQLVNGGRTTTDNDLVRYHIRVNKSVLSRNILCVYWSFDENNGSWVSDDGCRFHGFTDDYAQCYCKHLTHFGLLLAYLMRHRAYLQLGYVLPKAKKIFEPFSSKEEPVLTFVIYLGLTLSIFALTLVLITYLLFRCSYKNRLHFALAMLCLSLLFTDCFYIPFNIIKTDRLNFERNSYCNIFGYLFHYFLLTSFTWMIIMISMEYMHFFHMFDSCISNYFIKSTIIGWIVPLIFPMLVLIVGKNGGYISEHRCWINENFLIYITFIVPILVMILGGLFLFILQFKNLCQRKVITTSHHLTRPKLQIFIAFCCFLLIVCTWFFGIFVLLQPYFTYQLIFCISNALQSCSLFVFHVYLSKPKRELWQTFLIERGLHQRSQLEPARSDLTASVYSSSVGNISSIPRPAQLVFSSKSTPENLQDASNGSLVTLSSRDPIQSNRPSHLSVYSKPDLLSDRIQKVKKNVNDYYA